MPLLPDRPRTRLEEILRARGLSQTEVGQRTGWHSSTVNRLAIGRVQLTAHTRGVLARVCEVRESAFYEPIGSPIPAARRPRRGGAIVGFDGRLRAVLALLGLTDLTGLVRFLMTGEYGGLPLPLALRLRDQLGENQSEDGPR
jgi:transcriptional regulator with XRE-family HTH domain